jgi:hypothetical protein
MVLVGGRNLNGDQHIVLARVDTRLNFDLTGFSADGHVEAHAGSGTRSDVGRAVAIQPDGKIVVASDNYSDADNTDDFGVVRLLGHDDDEVVVSGRIVEDLKGNGLRNSKDPGIAGVRVYIDKDFNAEFDPATEDSVVTQANGKFTIPGLDDGSIDVRIADSPPGYRHTAPENDVLPLAALPGDHFPGLDFGLTRKVLISGVVFRDLNGDKDFGLGDKPLKNYRVYIDENENRQFDEGEAFTLTDADGEWSFTNLRSGEFVVRIQLKTNHVPVTPSRKRLTLDDGEVRTGIEFGVTTVA